MQIFTLQQPATYFVLLNLTQGMFQFPIQKYNTTLVFPVMQSSLLLACFHYHLLIKHSLSTIPSSRDISLTMSEQGLVPLLSGVHNHCMHGYFQLYQQCATDSHSSKLETHD